jgi:hypothetical protein
MPGPIPRVLVEDHHVIFIKPQIFDGLPVAFNALTQHTVLTKN